MKIWFDMLTHADAVALKVWWDGHTTGRFRIERSITNSRYWMLVRE
jgi:hypothetical protein